MYQFIRQYSVNSHYILIIYHVGGCFSGIVPFLYMHPILRRGEWGSKGRGSADLFRLKKLKKGGISQW